ncbi:type IV pili methyl-accepting chemotaxis transducer N-terminal domain-containing protein [Lichenicoccus sp.]|uniref:type IV pili methyl-accepting chemotaxis transducer N-terminal domain-containing protein n=1 Tax=Lichenicoccus sp. TaxID=2781899 RepID=UPI003D0BE36A
MSTSHGATAPPLARDLDRAGFTVIEASGRLNTVQDVIKLQADMIACFELFPDDAFFGSLAALARMAPRPVVVFTSDVDAGKISRAVEAGVHAYVVNGYDANRLRPVLQLAQARFASEQTLRAQLADVNARFAERKLVDRAKGILMGARQLREEEAFRALRNAAMASKQRIGQVSQTVIDSASYAELMNRAGRLRMLSQRLVKLYALGCAPRLPPPALLGQTIAQVDTTMAVLERSLPKATLGDLLESVVAAWGPLKRLLTGRPDVARLAEIDRLAEQLLRRAETLTTNLEVAAYATGLRVINIAGRQRMLSQRMAKEALIGGLTGQTDASPAKAEFSQGLAYLGALPVGNERIRSSFEQAMQVWAAFEIALRDPATDSGRERIALLSEDLLAHFDELTQEFERVMQTLVGV